MRIWFALVVLLYLQGSYICSEVRRRQDHVTVKNVTTVPPNEEITESSTTSTSSTRDDHSTTSPITFAATSDEISTTSIPSHRPASGRGGAHRTLRNRTQGVTLPNSVSSKGERERTTTPRAKETVTSPKTDDVSGDDPVTTNPTLPSTTDDLPTDGETAVETETPNDSDRTRADHQAGNVTGEAVQESRPTHCSNECAALRRSNAVRHSPLLAKLVHRLSKPGAFEKGKSVFEEETEMGVTLCPPGDIGLSCRQAEARRGAEECYGGNCEECRTCNEMAVTEWPHCCRDNFQCCSQLALACQQCDQPALQVFCSKHFKRCS